MTLLDISQEILGLELLLSRAAEAGADLETVRPDIDKWLAELGRQETSKVDGYCTLIRELELRSAARQEESERLAKRARIDAGHAEFLVARLKSHFEQHQIPKMETERFSVGIVKNGGKIPIQFTEPPERMPKEFVKVSTSFSADSDAIRAALESGQELPFAKLGQRGTRLSIR